MRQWSHAQQPGFFKDTVVEQAVVDELGLERTSPNMTWNSIRRRPGWDGRVLDREVFNAVGDTIAVTAVPSTALESLREDEILCARSING
jgi:hypothetical protein